MVKVWLFRIASRLCPLVPRRLGLWIASLVGTLAYYLAGGPRGVVESNMAVVLGPGAARAKVRWAARGVFVNAAKNYFDMFGVPKLDLKQFGRLVQTEGAERFLDAQAVGKGVIMVTAHLGNFDVCGQEIAARGLDVLALVEPLQPPEVFAIVNNLRRSKGVRFVPVGPGVVKEFVRTLRRGGTVGIACDRDIQKSGGKMPFFGAMASLPEGAAHLALRTGARIVPAFSERLPDDTFQIYVDEPLDVASTGDFEADVRTVMGQIVAAMERHIGARPQQWVVFERIWPDREQLPES